VDGDFGPVGGASAPARTDRWTDADRIVVLPFAIQGDDPSLTHLAAGLAHDVIASLARVSGIVVVARPSTERSVGGFGRAPVEIGRRLEADVVLDSSVRIVGTRLFLVGRLVDVRLERPVWAEVYEGTPSDLLAIRRRLLLDVLGAAGVRLSAVEEERLVRGQTASPEAFELYLEGHSRLGLRTGEEIETAIERFEAALVLDPDFALARAGLMDAFAQRHPALGHRLSETGLLARRAAREALALDPELGEVHATLGFLRGFVDHDWDGAVADLRRAIELSPGYASAHHWLGATLTFGRREFDEGARELEIARQLDPYSPAIRADIGLAHANRGDLDGARRLLSDLVQEESGFWRASYFLGVTCFAAGEPESGADHLRRAWYLGAFGAHADHTPPESAEQESWRDVLEHRLARLETSVLQPGMRAVEAALLSIVLGRRTDSIRWLGNVTEQGSAAWILAFFPIFEPLADDPAFREFLAEAGLRRRDVTAS
jgi:TolB-like protein